MTDSRRSADEPMSPLMPMLTAAMELVEGLSPLRSAVLGYKASLISDGWKEEDAERISTDLLIELNRKVLRL